MLLEEVKKEFSIRHDFEDDDLDILKERWSNIIFKNIPAAWIIIIDEMLCLLRYNNPIKEIHQEFGQFITLFSRELNPKQQQIIKRAEISIYNIDKDLYELLVS